jgi:hypothetical protein
MATSGRPCAKAGFPGGEMEIHPYYKMSLLNLVYFNSSMIWYFTYFWSLTDVILL